MADARGPRILLWAVVLFAVQAQSSAGAGMAVALTLTSSAFQAGGKIPSRYTCEGIGVSPPLAIAGVPPARRASH